MELSLSKINKLSPYFIIYYSTERTYLCFRLGRRYLIIYIILKVRIVYRITLFIAELLDLNISKECEPVECIVY